MRAARLLLHNDEHPVAYADENYQVGGHKEQHLSRCDPLPAPARTTTRDFEPHFHCKPVQQEQHNTTMLQSVELTLVNIHI